MTSDRLREIARSRVSLRVTRQTRATRGFVVVLNGEVVHSCPTHREAVNHAGVRLQTAPRLRLEIRPA